MKKSLLCFLILFANLTTYAQLQFSWAKGIQGYNRIMLSQVQGDRVLNYKDLSVYMCGQFLRGVDFNPGPGIDSQYNTQNQLSSFISKYTTAGTYVWTKLAPGPSAYALDTMGNIYVAGIFDQPTDFDPGPGVTMLTPAFKDLFLMKLDAQYNLLWAKNVATCNSAFEVKDLKVSNSGELVVCGFFSGIADFKPGISIFDNEKFQSSVRDGFVVKYNNIGIMRWVSNINGPSGDAAYQMALDAAGNPVVCGYTGNGSSFPTTTFKGTAPSFQLAIDANGIDGFLAKYNANGGIDWAKAQKGAVSFFPSTVALDKTGNIITGGVFTGTARLDVANAASNITATYGLSDSYLAKFSSSGSFLWSKILGSTGDDGIMSASTDSLNDIYITGYHTNAIDLNPGGTAVNFATNGYRDVFIARYNSAGTYKWSTHFGSIKHDEPAAINVAIDGSLYSTGYVSDNTDFNPGKTGGSVVFTEQTANTFNPFAYLARYGYNAEKEGMQTIFGDDFALKAYPNPVRNALHLEARLQRFANGKVCAISIVNMLGQLVYTEHATPFNSSWQHDLTIPTSCPDGVYQLVLNYNGTQQRTSLVVAR